MKGVYAAGLDFFRVSLNSLKDARLVRLIRVLEDKPGAASFWYLHKCNPGLITAAANESGLNIERLKSISASLTAIRNKTFMHIDKDGIFDPQSFYEAAGLNNDDVEKIIMSLWTTMNRVHFKVFDREVEGDEYPGTDIKALAELRDPASAYKSAQSDACYAGADGFNRFEWRELLHSCPSLVIRAGQELADPVRQGRPALHDDQGGGRPFHRNPWHVAR